MLQSHRFILKGRIPSKKNSKDIIPNKAYQKTGKGRPYFLISSKKHKEWHSQAMKQLMLQPSCKCHSIDHVLINFTFGDRRRTDLTNKAESVMDLLVDYKILNDDSWQEVPKLALSGKYEKGEFKAEIIIFYKPSNRVNDENSEVF